MAENYDEKKCRRQMELNSRRGSRGFDKQRRESRQGKRSKLIWESRINGLNSVSSSISYINHPLIAPAISVINDSETMDVGDLARIPGENEPAINLLFSEMVENNSTGSGLKLARWIRTNENLQITPLDQRYPNPNAMRDRCRRATPCVDQTILTDLKRAFHDPPTQVLSEIIHACHQLPFWIRDFHGRLFEQAKIFQSINHLSVDEVEHVSRINKHVTLRASYGVLFLQGNKFFAKTSPKGKQRRSAIKGFPMLKPDGQLEHPWETATRMIEQDVQYWSDEQREWQPFDLNKHTKEDDRQEYLECLVTSVESTELVRYIGLFVIRLRPDVRIGLLGSSQTEGENNWYSVEHGMFGDTFYTINPFLKYLLRQ